MHARKTILSASIALALGMASHTAQANLTTSATLDFTLGTAQVIACRYGTTPPCMFNAYNITDIVGSYFGLDDNANGLEPSEKGPIGSLNGIHIGTIQAASGSHYGSINGGESPNIDNPWTFFGSTGMHQITSPITVLVDNGFTKTLDFSGWTWLWNGYDNIPLVETAPTTITCDTSSCSAGSNYTLDGSFHIAGAGITSVPYFLHLEGTVSNVPVPAAAWLFGSGLAGLMGIARRRKAVE